VSGLVVERNEFRTRFGWSPPVASGAVGIGYDLLRASVASDFGRQAICVATDLAETTTIDFDLPAAGQLFHYLVRATNACPDGRGSLGTASNGVARVGRSCDTDPP
jgi:hypothetical protein